MRSQIFFTEASRSIEARATNVLNTHTTSLSPRTISSPRAVGEAIEGILGETLGEILGDLSTKYSTSFARRAMADFDFTDRQGLYYIVDVKTHRIDTEFNMPNLVSVKRLAKLYKDDLKYFTLMIISYRVDDSNFLLENVQFIPIESLVWDCLTIGALGTGQIQISNSNHITINQNYSRKTWMLELCDKLLPFYAKEIRKIGARIEYFQEVQTFWDSKSE